MTPIRHLEGVRAYSRAADAFDTIARRPPSAARFDTRVANDSEVPAPAKDMVAAMPGWVTIVAGGLVAALMGAMLGGALQI